MKQSIIASSLFALAATGAFANPNVVINERTPGQKRAEATGDYSIAIGVNTRSEGLSATAIGSQAEAKGGSTVAIGSYSSTDGDSTIAIGEHAHAAEWTSAAVGAKAKSTGGSSTAVGSASQATNGAATAIGAASNASGYNSTAVGSQAQASEGTASAFGNQSKATAGASTAVGVGTQASGIASTAVGSQAQASGLGAIAGGMQSSAAGGASVALGRSAKAEHDLSVALGAASATKEAVQVTEATVEGITYDTFAGVPVAVVSVGKEGFERQIVNVAPGEISETSTDAINGSQLYLVAGQVGKNAANITTNANNIASNTKAIQNNAVNIANNATNIEGNKVAINKNAGDIATNKGMIVALQEDQVRQDKAIAAAKTEVKAGENVSVVNVPGKDGQNVYTVSAKDSTATVSSKTDLVTVTKGEETKVGGANVTDYAVDLSDTAKEGINKGLTAVQGVNAGNNVTVNRDGNNVTINALRTDVVSGSDYLSVGNRKDDAEGVTTATVDLSADSKAAIEKARTALQDFLVYIDGKTVNTVDQDNNQQNFVTGKNMSLSAGENGAVVIATAEDVEFQNAVARHFRTGAVHLSADTVSAGGNKVTNVAAGDVSQSSTDAVNGSQLHATNLNVAGNTQSIENINRVLPTLRTEVKGSEHVEVTKSKGANGHDVYTVSTKGLATEQQLADANALVNKRVDGVAQAIGNIDTRVGGIEKRLADQDEQIAAVGAMANAELMQVYTPGQAAVSAGIGYYSGEAALKVGVSALSDKGNVGFKFHVSGNTQNKVGAGASIGFFF